MKITYYGHSCFSVTVKGKELLFDPFVTMNDMANTIVNIDAIPADYILVSHGHEDHIADCVRVATRTGGLVITNFEITEWLKGQKVPHVHAMNTGGSWNFGDFTVKCVVAHHSSRLPDKAYGGNPMGFIIYTDEGNFYYSGDTALTLDMQLIPRWAKLNFAVLPIGDNFTMGATDAAECAGMIACKTIVGVHYDTIDEITIDKDSAKKTFTDAGLQLHLIEIGDSLTI